MISLTDIIRFALTVLRERKLRAVLTIIGIAIGPAAMVAIIGTVQGYSNVIVGQLSSLGENTIVVFPTGEYSLGSSDITYIKNLKGVDSVTPFYNLRGTYKRSDGKTLDVSIYAIDLNDLFKVISSLKILEGNIPPSTAYSSGIIGYSIAFNENNRQMAKIGNVVTIRVAVAEENKIKVKIYNIRVTGILNKYGNALVMNPDTTIFLPLEAGRTILGLSKYTGILVTVKNSHYISSVNDKIKDKYKDLVNVIEFEEIAHSVGSVINTLNFLLFVLSISAFVVAITGIMATMFTSVIERTREIGVLKAIGYSSTQVLILILTESIIMSIIGGIAGISIGAVGAYILASRSFTMGTVVLQASPAITPELLLFSLGMAALVGVVGGLIPAYRASKVMPVVALRYE